jgi:hypothetical protein
MRLKMEPHLEMRRFRVLTYPEEPELADSWAAGVARDENQKQQTTTKSQVTVTWERKEKS